MADTAPAYRVGDVVYHRRFGAGKVVRIADGRVIARFDEGEKACVPSSDQDKLDEASRRRFVEDLLSDGRFDSDMFGFLLDLFREEVEDVDDESTAKP